MLSVLGKQVVANARTLEQKLADAGPSNQRIDPHIITPVRRELLEEGSVEKIETAGSTWFHLANTPKPQVDERLNQLTALFKRFTAGNLPLRFGQTLEIATYRAMLAAPEMEFYGQFLDLDDHDDSQLYSKEEPPQHIGKRKLPGKKSLDFIVRHPTAGHLGIECKNIREWIYPDRPEITDLLFKATTLNCVPVLIARRIPFVTFKLMRACGVIVHQTYNQLLPAADATLAAQLRQKELLGYHDIRVGNEPDARLKKFIATNLLAVAEEARERFNQHKDLITPFSAGDMTYTEFAARVRRRSQGANEDNDWNEEAQDFEPDYSDWPD